MNAREYARSLIVTKAGIRMTATVADNLIWRRLLWVAAILAVAFGIGLAVFATRLTPIVRNRALDMLRSRFDSEAKIGELQVSVLHGISVSGKRLVLRHHGRTDVPPLIEIREFSGEMGWLSPVGKPWHIRRVELKGRAIHIPPKQKRIEEKQTKYRDIPVIVDEPGVGRRRTRPDTQQSGKADPSISDSPSAHAFGRTRALRAFQG